MRAHTALQTKRGACLIRSVLSVLRVPHRTDTCERHNGNIRGVIQPGPVSSCVRWVQSKGEQPGATLCCCWTDMVMHKSRHEFKSWLPGWNESGEPSAKVGRYDSSKDRVEVGRPYNTSRFRGFCRAGRVCQHYIIHGPRLSFPGNELEPERTCYFRLPWPHDLLCQRCALDRLTCGLQARPVRELQER